MNLIHSGFASDIAQLNNKTATLSTVFNKRVQKHANYVGPIHVAVVGENISTHSTHLRTLATNASAHGEVHAGAAGFINLAYMAHSKAAAGILFDINAFQKPFWDVVIGRLKETEDGGVFRKELHSLEDEVLTSLSREPGSLRESFHAECEPFGGHIIKMSPVRAFTDWLKHTSAYTPEGQWMDNPKLYGHVHQMAKEDAIGAITLDIANTKACDEVGNYLDERDVGVGTLYISNILNFMQPLVRQRDFIGRQLADNTQETARTNVVQWLGGNGRVIECDNLERGTPLLLRVEGQRQPALAL